MERVTLSIEKELLKAFDELIEERGYPTRSEAMRDLLREKIQELRLQRQPSAHCLASVSYIYQHHQRDLTERLITMQHAVGDIVMMNSHIHLDSNHCMENLVLKGPTARVQQTANQIIAQRGVQYGHIAIMPTAFTYLYQK